MFKKKKQILSANQINLARYDLNAWLDTYPNSNEEEWLDEMSICDIYEYAQSFFDKYEITKNEPHVRITTIDDEYLDWLKDNNLENDQNNRIKYINSMTDEDALRLYNSHDYNQPIDTFGIPLSAHRKITDESNDNNTINTIEYTISDKIRTQIKEYFEEIYGKGNVFVSRYIAKPDIFYEESSKFENIAEIFFKNGKEVLYGKYADIKINHEANLIFMFLPVSIRCVRDSVIINATDLVNISKMMKEYPNFTYFAEMMEQTGIDLPNLDELDCFDEIAKEMGFDWISANPELVHITDSLTYMNNVIKTLQQTIKQEVKKGHIIGLKQI